MLTVVPAWLAAVGTEDVESSVGNFGWFSCGDEEKPGAVMM